MRLAILGGIILLSACLNPFDPVASNPLRSEADPLDHDECYGVILEDTLLVTTEDPLDPAQAETEEGMAGDLEYEDVDAFVVDTVIHRIYIQVCPT